MQAFSKFGIIQIPSQVLLTALDIPR